MLSIVEGRVVGVLLEKERTTPEQYPLSMNALVLACNQSTSRDPVMHLGEHEVSMAVDSLKVAGLLRYVHPSHGRSVTRYRQVVDERLELGPAAASLLGVLVLRGPQTAAELRSRTERMHSFASLEAVEGALRDLTSAQPPLVHLLDRQPGQSHQRWQQLVAEEPEPTHRFVAHAPGTGSVGERIDQLDERLTDQVARLDARIAALEAALADLL